MIGANPRTTKAKLGPGNIVKMSSISHVGRVGP
jgi:hypothetical protein